MGVNSRNQTKKEWDALTSPQTSESKEIQEALDWWHNLPIQNLQDMNKSWVGYLWKYYPTYEHPYHLTGEEILNIYQNENNTNS